MATTPLFLGEAVTVVAELTSAGITSKELCPISALSRGRLFRSVYLSYSGTFAYTLESNGVTFAQENVTGSGVIELVGTLLSPTAFPTQDAGWLCAANVAFTINTAGLGGGEFLKIVASYREF